MNQNGTKSGWKQKLIHELIEYWINVAYLAFFFVVFANYRRLILAEYQISYGDYGIGLIKALIFAKVIMIGDLLALGRKLEGKSLIVPTLYKTVVFSVWVGLFNVLEHMIRGLLHGRGVAGGINELINKGADELLSGCLVIFFAFIPFFAFRELARVLGEGRIRELFFRRTPARGGDLSEPEKN